jgi:hypothetical protein
MFCSYQQNEYEIQYYSEKRMFLLCFMTRVTGIIKCFIQAFFYNVMLFLFMLILLLILCHPELAWH